MSGARPGGFVINEHLICAISLLEDDQEAVNAAIDIADNFFAQSLDMAKAVIGFSPEVGNQVLTLANAHAKAALTVYVANKFIASMRELAPEIAGAFSEAGTDIGAGLVEGLQAVGSAICKQGT